MSLYEVTMLCIEQESKLEDLKALAERIDVLFLVGEKFEFEEYIKLADTVKEKIDQVTQMEVTPPSDEEVLGGGIDSENVEDSASNSNGILSGTEV